VPRKLHVITGATGLLGSHIAEQLIARGERVRALVRPTSDVTFLKQIGVQLAVGDLTDPPSLRRAFAGADIVYHSAAKVGEWGRWRVFQTEVIDATRNVLEACRAESVPRILHVSSITVYGHPKPRPGDVLTEKEPLGRNPWLWDYYCRSKIAAEELTRPYGKQVTIARPSWMYAPRDRTTVFRVFAALRAGRVKIIGDGSNLLNVIYAGDVAEGCILAANDPNSAGEAYNFSSEGEITQREFVDALREVLGLPRIHKHVPFRTGFWLGFLSEVIGKAIFLKRPPHITRYVVSLIGRPTQFSTQKARDRLGWQPKVNIREGLRRTLDWLETKERGLNTSVALPEPAALRA